MSIVQGTMRVRIVVIGVGDTKVELQDLRRVQQSRWVFFVLADVPWNSSWIRLVIKISRVVAHHEGLILLVLKPSHDFFSNIPCEKSHTMPDH